MYNLLRLYREKGMEEKALALDRELSLILETEMENGEETIEDLSFLAIAAMEDGDTKKVREILDRSVVRAGQGLDPHYPTHFIQQTILAQCYERDGEYDKAVVAYEKALSAVTIIYGKQGEITLGVMRKQAEYLTQAARQIEAAVLLEEVAEGRKAVLGEGDYKTILDIRNLWQARQELKGTFIPLLHITKISNTSRSSTL